jgi:DNA invertase Pin-like site-specific DNA recombinase
VVSVGELRREGQRERPAGLEGQRRVVAAACRRRGWRLLERVEDAQLAAKGGERVEPALPVLERAEPQALVAAKQVRLAQALLDLTSLLAATQKQGWALVALDSALEPSTPAGQAVANLVATVAPCERRLLSQRIREGLAQARSQGVRLGRPPTISAYVLERIRREHEAGKSLAAIANGLNTDRIPTAQGGQRWYPATIRYTLNRTR